MFLKKMSTANLHDSTNKPLYGESIIEEAKIICFENPNKKRIYEISIELPEFTCKCPFSGYPDFAKLNIFYQPVSYTHLTLPTNREV